MLRPLSSDDPHRLLLVFGLRERDAPIGFLQPTSIDLKNDAKTGLKISPAYSPRA
jgi:hypothetical protein